MPDPGYSDIELIERCINFDEQACALLYKRYSAWLYSVCLRYVSNKEDAQDILQEAFILIFRNLPQYSKTASFKGWIKRITVNAALASYRKKGAKMAMTNEKYLEEEEFADFSLLLELDNKELLYFIGLLSPGRKQVFNAYIIEGFSHQEIADQLGISAGTSKSQLFDAKRELKKAIDREYAVAKIRNI